MVVGEKLFIATIQDKHLQSKVRQGWS